MSTLAELLSSRARAAVFHFLFGLHRAELHVRALARQSGLNEATLRQELRKLKALDLVKARRDGNRTYYRANQDHPLYLEIHGLVLKTSGLVDVLKNALEGAEIQTAFVFGSVAKGDEQARSDIDLMVIGDISFRELTALLSGVSEQVDREVNPHVMTAGEYARRIREGDHFVTRVLSGPKLFVVGTEDELGAVGR